MKNFILIVLGIIIGFSIAYFYFNSSSQIDQDKRNDFESFIKGPQVGADQGAPISASEANKRLKRVKEWKEKLWNKKNVFISSGYSFGLTPLKELIQKIDQLNIDDRHQPGDSISGIRVHLALIDTVNAEGKKIKYTDVFLSPVQQSGRNYVYIEEKYQPEIIDGGLILNQSNPCPEYCDDPGKKQ